VECLGGERTFAVGGWRYPQVPDYNEMGRREFGLFCAVLAFLARNVSKCRGVGNRF
jgi:hypothetical protein